jgi:hypothetical protein
MSQLHHTTACLALLAWSRLAAAQAPADLAPPAAAEAEAAPTAEAPASAKLALWPAALKLPPAKALATEQVLAEALAQAFALTVVTSTEIKAALPAPQKKALAKCKRPACFAAAGGTLGTKWWVTVQGRAAKKSLQLALVLLDEGGKPLARSAYTGDPAGTAAADLRPALEPFVAALGAMRTAEATSRAAGSATAEAGASTAAAAAPPASSGAVESQAAANNPRRAGWLGIRYNDVDENEATAAGLSSASGVYVTRVTDEGPAAAAGLQVGDVIVAFAGHEVTSQEGLLGLLAAAHAGDVAICKLWRAGAARELTVTLGERPAP